MAAHTLRIHGALRAATRHARGVTVMSALAAAALGMGCAAQAAGSRTPGRPAGASALQSSSPSTPATATGPFGNPAAPPTPTGTPTAPAGFQPEAVTAVSESQYWVLGTDGDCTGCPSLIWHTTDAGQTFTSIPTPPTQFANASQGMTSSVSDLRYADGVDGWAFGPGLWATHDDGGQWRSIDLQGDVVDLEPAAGGYVYAVVDMCVTGGNGVCPVEVVRGTAASDAWSVVLTLSDEGEPPPSLGVHGADVWLLGVGGLWRSPNDGASFEQLPTPCSADLGGRIDPVTASVVWAFCPTGNEGGPCVSTDSGVTFSGAYGHEMFSNAGEVAALSASTALVTDSSDGLVETDDGGASYRAVPGFGGNPPMWVGLTDTSVGYAWVLDQLPGGTQCQLWRTVDGGAAWTLVTLP